VREELYGRYRPYSLLQMDRLTIFSQRGAYIYRGYPIAMREVNFENKHVEQGAVTTRAEYVGLTPYEAIHELLLRDLGPLQSIDGLSGSPVFQIHNEEGTQFSREAFAGMLVRGSIESGKIFLVEHSRIIEVLLTIKA
jgi:predicted HD phosphohydrolase